MSSTFPYQNPACAAGCQHLRSGHRH